MNPYFTSACRRLEVYNHLDDYTSDEMAAEVSRGLSSENKYLSSKYFYDAKGSKLFERICQLPEYYPTRIELSLLERFGRDITHGISDGDLVELGSGANQKIRTLIDSMQKSRRQNIRYVPVDISHAALIEASTELLEIYPDLHIQGVIGDFNQHQYPLEHNRPKLFLFLGSTIGNLDENESRQFLAGIAGMMTTDDRLLLGLDMLKPVATLEAAYNDSQGVTAEFNKNLMRVINNGLNGDFDPEAFDHQAFFNPKDERIEMHLKAQRRLTINIRDLDLTIGMDEGETIRTEICRKFSRKSAGDMIHQAGLEITNWYTDPDEWFTLALLTKRMS